MKIKFYLFLVAILALVAFGGAQFFSDRFFVEKSQEASVLQSSANPVDVVIVMAEEGFEPAEVIVKKGQTISWENNSVDWRWPASNLHPTHFIYPEFDPLEPIAPGKSWAFTFEKVGEWRFHDHLKAYMVGTIIVED